MREGVTNKATAALGSLGWPATDHWGGHNPQRQARLLAARPLAQAPAPSRLSRPQQLPGVCRGDVAIRGLQHRRARELSTFASPTPPPPPPAAHAVWWLLAVAPTSLTHTKTHPGLTPESHPAGKASSNWCHSEQDSFLEHLLAPVMSTQRGVQTPAEPSLL